MQLIGAGAFTVFLGLSLMITGLLAAPVLLFGQGPARSVIRFWAWMVSEALKFFTGVSHRIDGKEYIPTGAAIVAANHQSMWETIILLLILPKPIMIFKRELVHIPVYGWWAQPAGHIAVDRKGGAKALRAMRDKAAQRLREGCQIVVFPEGTRVAPGDTAPYHPGVAGIYTANNAACIPAAHDSGRFWHYPGIDKTRGEITLKFLPPIETGLDRKSFLKALKTKIDSARPDLLGTTNKDAGHEQQ